MDIENNEKNGLVDVFSENRNNENSIINVEDENYKMNDYEVSRRRKNLKNDDKKVRGSSVGYFLGLIGSIFSAVVCFFTGLGLFLFDNLIQGIFLEILDEILDDMFFLDYFLYSGDMVHNIFTGSIKLGVVIFVIILIGVILSFVGTMKSWNNVSIISSSIMIIGGIFSLFCLMIPGILIIIGGVLNMKCAIDNVK